jgi:hypothetical protein
VSYAFFLNIQAIAIAADHDALRVKLAVADLQQIEGLKVGGLQRKHALSRQVRAAHFDSGKQIGRRDRFSRQCRAAAMTETAALASTVSASSIQRSAPAPSPSSRHDIDKEEDAGKSPTGGLDQR